MTIVGWPLLMPGSSNVWSRWRKKWAAPSRRRARRARSSGCRCSMLNKWSSIEEALAPVQDGAIMLIGGFGGAGTPTEHNHALIDQGASELTVMSNNAGSDDRGLAGLLRAGRVRRLVCSYPRPTPGLDGPFTALYR